MPLVPRLRSLWRNLVRRGDLERELDDELDSYVELLAEERIRAGEDERSARRHARLALGGRESVKEQVRDRRLGHHLDVLARDLAFGIRMLSRSSGSTVVALVILTLGIGASAAVFSVVHGVLLEALPYPDPERLVYVWASDREGRTLLSAPDFVELGEQTTSFAELGALRGRGRLAMSIDGRAVQVWARDVTPNFLAVYGAEPFRGRSFTPEDDDVVSFEDVGNATVTLPTGAVMVSHAFWRDRLGADPGVVGRLVEIELQPYRIIGVTPPGFEALVPAGPGPNPNGSVDVWGLSRMDLRNMPRDVAFLRPVARLARGVTIAEARAELERFADLQRQRFPLHREGDYRLDVVSLHDGLTRPYAVPILVLFGAVLFVLLIACANLANLLLVRSAARRRELAVRMALGSGRARLVRQLLTESLVLALLGGTAGLLVTGWLVRLIVRLAPPGLPRVHGIGVDGPVLAFALASVLAVTLLMGLVPALRFSRPREIAALRQASRDGGGAGRRHWDGLLVAAEVALSVMLVIGSALLLRSLDTLLHVDAGFRADRLLTGELHLTSRRYPRYPVADSRVRFVHRVTERLSHLPGVEAVGLGLVAPLSGEDAGHSFASQAMVDSGRPLPPAKYRPVTPGYFAAVGTGLLAGRPFTWSDLEENRLVSIVDERLARRAWPGESPIGKRLRLEVWSTRSGRIALEPIWTEVVGLCQNVRSARLSEDDVETVYLPYGLYAYSELFLLVRTASDPRPLVEAVRAEVAEVDSDVPLYDVRVMDDLVFDNVAPQRFSLTLLGAFGLAGLALALLGLYGVLAHAVSLRRRELGVRMALGARRADILRLVLARGAALAAVGLVFGLVGAGLLSRFLESLLYGVRPVDLPVYGIVALCVLAVSLAACWLPARSAARIDPMATLRTE